MARILVVDKDPNCRLTIRELLESMGHRVVEAEDGKKAITNACSYPLDLVMLDIDLPKLQGTRGIKTIRDECSDLPLIITASPSKVDTAVSAMKVGLCDYLVKPLNMLEVKARVERILDHSSLLALNLRLVRELCSQNGMNRPIAADPATKETLAAAERIAQTDLPVLISGERGSGKEFVSRVIHQESIRSESPFVKVNRANSTQSSFVRKLFGEENCSPTGGRPTPGCVELADGGVIFIAEISEASRDAQSRLLRLLREHRFERIGGIEPIDCDIRLIAATNAVPEEALENGKIDPELYDLFRPSMISIPPLRDRRDDIPALVEYFIKKASAEFGRSTVKIAETAMAQLLDLEWKGNIQELEYLVKRSVLVCDGDCIQPTHLSISGSASYARRKLHSQMKSIREIEREHIRRVLTHCNWNRSLAASILEVDRKTLRSKIREFGLVPPDQA